VVTKALQPVPAIGTFRLEPLPLTEQQQRQLCKAAVQRVLQTQKTSQQQLRSILVAKLAALGDAGLASDLLQELVKVCCNLALQDLFLLQLPYLYCFLARSQPRPSIAL
jgi:hypothetical protein